MKTGGPNDKGCDAIAIKDEVYSHYRYCIQIKRYSKTTRVGINDIREVIDGIDIYKCDRGLIITTSSFSPEAISRAKSKNIELIDGNKLEEVILKFSINIPLVSSEAMMRDEEDHVEYDKEMDIEDSSTKVKDEGIYFPIPISKALDLAKKEISLPWRTKVDLH